MVTVPECGQPIAGSRHPKTPANGNRNWALASKTCARRRADDDEAQVTGPGVSLTWTYQAEVLVHYQTVAPPLGWPWLMARSQQCRWIHN